MMTFHYKIQSVVISPDGFLFEKTTEEAISSELSFESPREHGDTRHMVTYECDAESIRDAWVRFYKTTTELLDAIVFQTSSYLSFHDWNHIISNQSQGVALISVFERSLGTSLGVTFKEDVDDVLQIMASANSDSRFKNFLHNYRMAVAVDVAETQDAYEKYLILACESLAGEVDNGKGGKKYDSKRLIAIIGKELHKYFFSSIDPQVGKTIRNANMHIGKSSNLHPSQTVKLVNKLREFCAKEYGLNSLTIIKEEHSPTRGLYRDDGGILLVKGSGVENLRLQDIKTPDFITRQLPEDLKILGGKEANDTFKNM